MSDKAPNGLPWGPPGEVPDTEWAWVRLRWGTKPLIGRRTATIEHPQFYCFAPVLDIAALQDQLATAERRARLGENVAAGETAAAILEALENPAPMPE